MIKNNEPVIIERVANGFQVRPLSGNNDAVCVDDIHVFQQLGLYETDTSKLFGWLDSHFPPNPEPKS